MKKIIMGILVLGIVLLVGCEEPTGRLDVGREQNSYNDTENESDSLFDKLFMVDGDLNVSYNISYTPILEVECDSLFESVKNRTLFDFTGLKHTWAFKCLELTEEKLITMNESMIDMEFRIVKDGKCYGACMGG